MTVVWLVLAVAALTMLGEAGSGTIWAASS